MIQAVREIAESRHRPIAILQDLSGPKIRTGRLKGGGPVELRDGRAPPDHDRRDDRGRRGASSRPPTTRCRRTCSPATASCSTTATWSCAWSRTQGEIVEASVVHGGLLKPNKGMNLPGVTPLHARAHREGPPRPRVRHQARRRLRRAVLRAPGRGRGGGQGAHPLAGRDGAADRQDREARGHRRPGRRSWRRPTA